VVRASLPERLGKRATFAQVLRGVVADLLREHEQREHAPAPRDAVGGLDAPQLLVDHCLVERRLLARERADDLHLVLLGQVLDDRRVALEAPQDERPHDAAQARGGFVVAIPLDGHGEVAAEGLERPQETRICELEDRPQLGEAVLDGRARQREAVGRAQARATRAVASWRS
jgi:hypothetical protein